jgi:hypothetical protein
MESVATQEEIFSVGIHAQHYTDRYFAHQAALHIARDARSDGLLPPVKPGKLVPEFTVRQGDGKPPLNATELHFAYFLQRGRVSEVAQEFDQIYFKGALLTLGDELAQHDYFDRAPELELIRHLRNGIAHGNRFDIRNPASLAQYPAHTRLMLGQNVHHRENVEVCPSLHGSPVLFDFIGPLSLTRLFVGVSFYLLRMANGEPLREP